MAFYTLSPVQDAMAPTDHNMKDPQSEKMIIIGVGPVRLPDFLNKPQIMTRKGSGRINYSEFHRWGGYLDKDFLRVMSENLSALLSTDQVKTYPWGGQADPAFEVDFDVKQFDGDMQGDVVLNVIWQIRDNSDRARPVLIRRSIIREPVNASEKNDYEAVVSAQSRALGRLSEEIAKEMSKP